VVGFDDEWGAWLRKNSLETAWGESGIDVSMWAIEDLSRNYREG
jgi:hypothetical protein